MKKEKLNYHLVGICGSSMSGIAQYLQATGNIVTGSDLRGCAIMPLSNCPKGAKSIKVYLGHDAKHINRDIDIVVRTSAVTLGSEGWKEIEAAKKLEIKIIKRSELIGRLLLDKVSIGVTGMHGKSTTSSMITFILKKAGLEPNYLIGAEVKDIGSSAGFGKPVIPPLNDKKKPIYIPHNTMREGKVEYFVVEACEHDRSFLDMKPKIGVIVNIDREHLDYYKGGIKEIKQAFKKFIKQLPKDGLLVVWQEDKYIMSLIKSAKCKVKRVSSNKIWPGLKLKIPGKHNLLNATMAARVAHELGIDHKIIVKALNSFTGAGRRFELKGEKDGVMVIDDYGHHPTEIKATIEGAREKYSDKKIIVVFQPHQQARTRLLFSEFIKCFDGVDELIIDDVYKIAGREKETDENLSIKLVDELTKKGINTKYISGYVKIGDYLAKEAKKNDIIITQGATDIYKVGEAYLSQK